VEIDAIIETLKDSRIFDLAQPNFQGMPAGGSMLPGFSYFLYRRHSDEYAPPTSRRTQSSGATFMTDHVGTHIDAICHQAYDLQLFRDIRVDESVETPKGFTKHGAETIQPILKRGILLDIASYKDVDVLLPNYTITRSDLSGAARKSGITLEDDDVVLIRTGNGKFWTETSRYFQRAGLDKDSVAWLTSKSIFAVGCDSAAPDAPTYLDPMTGDSHPAHLGLLVKRGIYIVENMYLEELSKSGNSQFLFVALPIKVVGATAAPVRPIAVV
jgi:kynurenine formamidase